MRKDFKSLKDNNQKLMGANASASASFTALNDHAKQVGWNILGAFSVGNVVAPFLSPLLFFDFDSIRIIRSTQQPSILETKSI